MVLSKFKKKKVRLPQIRAIQFLALGFAFLIVVGGGLLTLPVFSRDGQITPFIDALFTATSAVCVTGLTTVTTLAHWNFWGQLLILVLIEIGGLGFMILPILFFTLFRKKVGLKTRVVLQEALNVGEMSGVMKLMLYIIRFAVAIQVIGMILLAFSFVPRYGFAKGFWYAIFHSISAFCNAGFDLFGDSLVSYQSDPYVLLVISGLIIAGGLGFIVWRDILYYPQKRKLTLHSQVALLITTILLVGGTVLFVLTEKNAQYLAPHSTTFEKFVNCFFMSVTARTAGYFSVDYGMMSQAGLLLTCILMFVGGTSGSTAGGLKTTTLGVLLIQAVSMLKGRQHAEFSERTIRPAAVYRALTLFFISLTLCVAMIMVLSITEIIPRTSGIEYIMFEVFSAFGTVGLTAGLTPNLSVAGKLLIIGLMYIGRVGVLTVGFSLTMHGAKTKQLAHYKYPEESVIIG
ncbi:TrkH family potassium uptake protein [Enterococcus sp. CSURQ0835]|uniref:TrkH family potassium uptake protein n=1 Tax=Enterococcus sp. CSURQ0835 TaxID=2681394 RepID=UPI00135CD6B4